MSLEFSALHLIIGDESPSVDILNLIFTGEKDTHSVKDTSHYLITAENQGNQYFWFYARYGKSIPYSGIVYNTKNEQEENNPRQDYQIEIDKQLFGLYYVNSRTLYLSNTKKLSWLEEYLKAKLNKDVVIKRFLKDVNEFIQQITRVEKVKLVVKRNLFSSGGEIMKIFPSPKDLYGLGMPEDFTLEANFSDARLTDTFIRFLKKMVGWQQNCQADSLVCVGRDDSNFETVFNVESFTQKVSIDVAKNNQGMYDPVLVKRALIDKIEGTHAESS